VECDRHNLVHPDAEPRVPYVTAALADSAGPVVAVSDWMRAVPDLIRPWVPSEFSCLGTDGFGFSDTRPAARRHFAVDAESITVAVLAALARRGDAAPEQVREAATRYRIDDPQAPGPQTSDPGVA
jgi:pyruvate dehydrogenase E1 component